MAPGGRRRTAFKGPARRSPGGSAFYECPDCKKQVAIALRAFHTPECRIRGTALASEKLSQQPIQTQASTQEEPRQSERLSPVAVVKDGKKEPLPLISRVEGQSESQPGGTGALPKEWGQLEAVAGAGGLRGRDQQSQSNERGEEADTSGGVKQGAAHNLSSAQLVEKVQVLEAQVQSLQLEMSAKDDQYEREGVERDSDISSLTARLMASEAEVVRLRADVALWQCKAEQLQQEMNMLRSRQSDLNLHGSSDGKEGEGIDRRDLQPSERSSGSEKRQEDQGEELEVVKETPKDLQGLDEKGQEQAPPAGSDECSDGEAEIIRFGEPEAEGAGSEAGTSASHGGVPAKKGGAVAPHTPAKFPPLGLRDRRVLDDGEAMDSVDEKPNPQEVAKEGGGNGGEVAQGPGSAKRSREEGAELGGELAEQQVRSGNLQPVAWASIRENEVASLDNPKCPAHQDAQALGNFTTPALLSTPPEPTLEQEHAEEASLPCRSFSSGEAVDVALDAVGHICAMLDMADSPVGNSPPVMPELRSHGIEERPVLKNGNPSVPEHQEGVVQEPVSSGAATQGVAVIAEPVGASGEATSAGLQTPSMRPQQVEPEDSSSSDSENVAPARRSSVRRSLVLEDEEEASPDEGNAEKEQPHIPVTEDASSSEDSKDHESLAARRLRLAEEKRQGGAPRKRARHSPSVSGYDEGNCRYSLRSRKRLFRDSDGSEEEFDREGDRPNEHRKRLRRVGELEQDQEEGRRMTRLQEERERQRKGKAKVEDSPSEGAQAFVDDELDDWSESAEGHSTDSFVTEGGEDEGEALKEYEGSESGESVSEEERTRPVKWELEGDMQAALGKDVGLCLRAVCAIFRRQTKEEQRMRTTIFKDGRGFSQFHDTFGSKLATFMVDDNPSGPVVKSVEEVRRKFGEEGLKKCEDLAFHYAKQLWKVYESRDDPDSEDYDPYFPGP